MINTTQEGVSYVPPEGSTPDTGASVQVRRMQPHLGTYVEVCASASETAVAEQAVTRAFEAIREAHLRWSFQDPASELSALNGAPGHRVPVSAMTSRLLLLSRSLMQRTAGAFDVTVGGELVRQGYLPDHGGPTCIPRGTADDIVIGDHWAKLVRPVRLVLDGVAKGLAVDIAVRAMRKAGADAGWVNAGGDLRSFGGVTIPIVLRDAHRCLRSAGGLRDMALATSTVTSMREERDPAFPGRVIGHRGRPASTGSWSVLARSAWRADALTKVAACTPARDRKARVRSLGGNLLEVPR